MGLPIGAVAEGPTRPDCSGNHSHECKQKAVHLPVRMAVNARMRPGSGSRACHCAAARAALPYHAKRRRRPFSQCSEDGVQRTQSNQCRGKSIPIEELMGRNPHGIAIANGAS